MSQEGGRGWTFAQKIKYAGQAERKSQVSTKLGEERVSTKKRRRVGKSKGGYGKTLFFEPPTGEEKRRKEKIGPRRAHEKGEIHRKEDTALKDEVTRGDKGGA